MAQTDAEMRTVALKLRRWARSTKQMVAHVHREASWDVARNIITGGPYSLGTPVDTGAARDSWTAYSDAEGAPRPFTKKVARDQTGLAAMQDALRVFNQSRAFAPLGLVTACPYMVPLEEGHSGQAPRGMVWVTVRAWKMIVRDAKRRVKAGATYTSPPLVD